MKELCTWARQFPIKHLCIVVRHLQLGIRLLPLEDHCVGVRQLQLEYMIGDRQFLVGGCYSLELENPQWINRVGIKQFHIEECTVWSSWNQTISTRIIY